MGKEQILYDDGTHKCIMFSLDDEEVEDFFLSVNQFLIIQNNSAVLIDPGSEAVYEELREAVSKHISLDRIKYIFFSHQDPDVAASITHWSIATQAEFIISKLWIRFLSHYGFMEMSRLLPLEDGGAKIGFGQEYLRFVPAHFLHSPGNFSLYDSRSQILFSGDIGAAIVPNDTLNNEAKSFHNRLEYLEPFHKRYMAGNRACRKWSSEVRKLPLKAIAPQHGAPFDTAEDISAFLEWFEGLQCGMDLED